MKQLLPLLLVAILTVIATSISGCTTPLGKIDYCSFGHEARCTMEQNLENKANAGLQLIGSAAVLDYQITCPNDSGSCVAPAVPAGKAEQGDWRVIKVQVDGRTLDSGP